MINIIIFEKVFHLFIYKNYMQIVINILIFKTLFYIVILFQRLIFFIIPLKTYLLIIRIIILYSVFIFWILTVGYININKEFNYYFIIELYSSNNLKNYRLNIMRNIFYNFKYKFLNFLTWKTIIF